MTNKPNSIQQKENLVVKFVGDSGDGMQLIGTLFSDASALAGNDLATFPDFPAEIRAPHNTIPGVSGFQVHIGQTKIYTPGDLCDVLITMNPASLKSNLKWAKKGATLIVNESTFEDDAIAKAGYAVNPLTDGSLKDYHLVAAPITLLTKKACEEFGIDLKTIDRSKNMFALGMLCFITGRGVEHIFHLFDKKFIEKPKIKEINKTVFRAGYNYAETSEVVESIIDVPPAGSTLEKGRYRNVTGNVATAWGLLAAAEKSGRPLFLGSYPITPATEILYELALHKSLGARVFQAEDEIAGICSAIGASFAGAMACTTTSGPGLSLKSEALGLAVMTELPLVVVNVQRAGPSTGIPTKSEQSDLNQALFGRNGEAPLVVMSASSPSDCFYAAFEAARIAMETMTPVILLSDGYIGFGSELFKIPKMASLPKIHPPIAAANDPNYKPYNRDPETLIRQWAIPGTEGLRHRIGGLEKEDGIGNVSSDPLNHQKMVTLRRDKVQKIAERIPLQSVVGEETGDLLVVSWGGTRGATLKAVQEMQAQGKKVSLAHFSHIMPLPKNTEKLLSSFKKIIVPELNDGQFVNYLRMKFPHIPLSQYNKVQGLPFTVSELTEQFIKIMEVK
ncbi:MAG: 2-oxoacid:acceptor oxidoreductase subunit alpha [Bacteroidales bacterium]|nr:2-oxoacid:acceptor oxidoreductase subunit alpha [Bacteroidales bacterium]